MAILPVSQNNTFNQWLSATNQSANVLNQLTDGVLNVNGTIIFTNSNFNLTLAGNAVANNITLTAPSGNTLFLQSSNASINGIVYVTGLGTSLHANNGIFNTLNVLGNVNVSNVGVSGLTTFNQNINVSNLTTSNVITTNVIANSITIINTTISNSNVTLNNLSANIITVTGNTNSTGITSFGNGFSNNVIVNNNLIVSQNTVVNNSLVLPNGGNLANNLNMTLTGSISVSNIQGNPTLINCSIPTPLQNDNSLNVATTSYVAPAFNNIGRNFVLNPNFDINQRGNTSWTFNGFTDMYTVDRWRGYVEGVGDSITITPTAMGNTDLQQIGDETGNNYINLTFTGGANSNNLIQYYQNIENVTMFTGQQFTLSFWANSPTSLRLACRWANVYGPDATTSPQVSNGTFGSVTLSPNWQRYSLTVSYPSSNNVSFGSDITYIVANNSYAEICFVPSCPLSSPYTLDANNIGQQSGTINIWGVQLEPGPTMSPYHTREPQQDLALCQRYYCPIFMGFQQVDTVTNQQLFYTMAFPVTMRIGPTITIPTASPQLTVTSITTSTAIFEILSTAAYSSYINTIILNAEN